MATDEESDSTTRTQGFGRPYVYIAAIVLVMVVAAFRSMALFSLFATGLVLIVIGVLVAAMQHAKWERGIPWDTPEAIYAYMHTAPKWGIGQSLSLAGGFCVVAGLLWLARLSNAL
jgi:hypothetical protein